MTGPIAIHLDSKSKTKVLFFFFSTMPLFGLHTMEHKKSSDFQKFAFPMRS